MIKKENIKIIKLNEKNNRFVLKTKNFDYNLSIYKIGFILMKGKYVKNAINEIVFATDFEMLLNVNKKINIKMDYESIIEESISKITEEENKNV